MKLILLRTGRVASFGTKLYSPLRKLLHSRVVDGAKKRVFGNRKSQEQHDEQDKRMSRPDGICEQEPWVQDEEPVINYTASSVGSDETDEEVDEQERKIEDLLHEFDMCRIMLEVAQDRLYGRDGIFAKQREERFAKLEAGEVVPTQSEVDASELQATQRMTRELILDEEQYELAKAALLAEKIQPPGSGIDSGFADDVDDGYTLSSENELTITVDKARIHKWQDSHPDWTLQALNPNDGDGDENLREMDDWNATEVDISDSWSLVANGGDRRRIDKWRAQAAATREALSAFVSVA